MRFIRRFKLEDLCLKVVIENLETFIYGQPKYTPQRHIDFLLRLYSEECFRQFTSANPKTEECLLWFLNPYNKKVILPNITENILMKLQILGPAITSLNLRESIATENMLNSVICCIPNISDLDLSCTACSDKTLLCIQKMCPNLVTLNIQECFEVTDDGMINLCGNNLSLRNLNIFCTSVEYIGLHDILKGMPSLQTIIHDNMADSLMYIHENELCTSAYKNIKYNLTELIYEDLGMWEDPAKVVWAWTVLCPNVKKVHILFPVQVDVLHLCSRFQNLEELKLKMLNYIDSDIDFDIDMNIQVPSDVLSPFLPLAKNISTLDLCYVDVPAVILVECFKNLKNLYLENISFIDFHEEEIKCKNTNLDSLTIKGLHMDVSTNTYKFILLLISLSKNVTKLCINNVENLPDDLICTILNSMKSLTYVDFSFTGMPQSTFTRFFEMPSLQKVYLDACSSSFTQSLDFPPHATTLSWCIMHTMYEDSDSDGFDEI